MAHCERPRILGYWVPYTAYLCLSLHNCVGNFFESSRCCCQQESGRDAQVKMWCMRNEFWFDDSREQKGLSRCIQGLSERFWLCCATLVHFILLRFVDLFAALWELSQCLWFPLYLTGFCVLIIFFSICPLFEGSLAHYELFTFRCTFGAAGSFYIRAALRVMEWSDKPVWKVSFFPLSLHFSWPASFCAWNNLIWHIPWLSMIFLDSLIRWISCRQSFNQPQNVLPWI